MWARDSKIQFKLVRLDLMRTETYSDWSIGQVGHETSEPEGQSVCPRLFSSQNASANFWASGESCAPYGRSFPFSVNDLRNLVTAVVSILGSLPTKSSE